MRTIFFLVLMGTIVYLVRKGKLKNPKIIYGFTAIMLVYFVVNAYIGTSYSNVISLASDFKINDRAIKTCDISLGNQFVVRELQTGIYEIKKDSINVVSDLIIPFENYTSENFVKEGFIKCDNGDYFTGSIYNDQQTGMIGGGVVQLVPHADKDAKDYTLVLAPAQFKFKVENETVVYKENIELIKAFLGFYLNKKIDNGKTYEFVVSAEKGNEKGEEKVRVKVEKNKITFINERQPK